LQDTDPLSFQCTDEQFGITKIPGTLQTKNDYSSYAVDAHEDSGIYPTKLLFSQLQGKQKNIYEYLANAQQTKYAVIPLHTEDEFNLFHEAVKVGGIWAAPTGLPDFENMATWWSSKANGKTIFYKLREHLATYYKIWLDKRKQNEAMVASLPVRKKNDSRIRLVGHIAHVLPAALHNQPGVSVTSADVEMGESEAFHPEEPIAQHSEMPSHDIQQLFHLSEPLETSPIFAFPSIPTVSAPSGHDMAAITATGHDAVSKSYMAKPIQSTLGMNPVLQTVASTSTTQFVPWGSEARRTRRCAVCIQAGRGGYNCPGNKDRSKCKYL